MFVWQLLFFHFYSFIPPFDQSVSVSQFVLQVSKPILAITRLSYETGYIIVVDTHVPFWYGSYTSSLYECVWSVYVYEICLCLSACVLLRVLLVHMDATHCTWCMNMYNTHMGLYIWVCTYRCSNEIWEINWHFVGISPARTAVLISALNIVPRGVFISFRFILFQYQQVLEPRASNGNLP